jgi:hypothetical protein
MNWNKRFRKNNLPTRRKKEAICFSFLIKKKNKPTFGFLTFDSLFFTSSHILLWYFEKLRFVFQAWHGEGWFLILLLWEIENFP